MLRVGCVRRGVLRGLRVGLLGRVVGVTRRGASGVSVGRGGNRRISRGAGRRSGGTVFRFRGLVIGPRGVRVIIGVCVLEDWP